MILFLELDFGCVVLEVILVVANIEHFSQIIQAMLLTNVFLVTRHTQIFEILELLELNHINQIVFDRALNFGF